MRYYNCFYYHKTKDGKLEINPNSACWAGLNKYYISEIKAEEIYIDCYKEKETEEYIQLIVDIINKITPCEIVKIENKEYIYFKLLKTYDQSLVVLNFIRNLWNGTYDYYDKTKNNIYNIEFFKVLKESKKYRDPLKKLTNANLVAATKAEIKVSTGHSNIHKFDQLKIKDTKSLLCYEQNSTQLFLTTN